MPEVKTSSRLPLTRSAAVAPHNSRGRLINSSASSLTPRKRLYTNNSNNNNNDDDEEPNLQSANNDDVDGNKTLGKNYKVKSLTFILILILFGFFLFYSKFYLSRSSSASLVLDTNTESSPSALHSTLASLQIKLEQIMNQQKYGGDSVRVEIQQVKDQLQVYKETQKRMIENISKEMERKINKKVKDDLEIFVNDEIKKVTIAANNITREINNNNNNNDINNNHNNFYQQQQGAVSSKVDWARAAVGTTIDYRFTSRRFNHSLKNILFSYLLPFVPDDFQFRVPPMSKPIDVIIGGPQSASVGLLDTDVLHPAHCFSFAGSKGNVTLHLPALIEVTEVQIDHLPFLVEESAVKESAVKESAPKTIAIYTDVCKLQRPSEKNDKKDKNEKDDSLCWEKTISNFPPHKLVGQFDFDYPSVSTQIPFASRTITRRIRFEILSNHGNESYSCIYRLRVFGNRVKVKKVEDKGEEHNNNNNRNTEL